ncbi:MAG: hypothetical protein ACOYT4_00975 [Nanoarchaeota archaeon]
MVKSKENLIGAWAFLIGIIISIVIGLLNVNSSSYISSTSSMPYAILVILGFIIGFLNVGDKDCMTFLFASLALVIVSRFGQDTFIYMSQIPILNSLNSILSALLVLFIPATIIVVLKTVFSIAKV